MNGTIQFTPGEVSTYYAARVPHLKQRRAAEWRGACPIHHGKNDNFAVDPDNRAVVLSLHLRTRRRHSGTRSGSDRRGLPDPEGRSLPAGGADRTRIPAQRHPHEWKFGGHGTYKTYKTHRHGGRVA